MNKSGLSVFETLAIFKKACQKCWPYFMENMLCYCVLCYDKNRTSLRKNSHCNITIINRYVVDILCPNTFLTFHWKQHIHHYTFFTSIVQYIQCQCHCVLGVPFEWSTRVDQGTSSECYAVKSCLLKNFALITSNRTLDKLRESIFGIPIGIGLLR